MGVQHIVNIGIDPTWHPYPNLPPSTGKGIRNRSRTPRRSFPTLCLLRDISSFAFAQDKPLRLKSSFDYSSFVNFALFVVNFLLLQNLLQQFLHRLRVQKADNLILFALDTSTLGQHVVLGNVAAHRLRSFQFFGIHHLLPDRLALSG